jgi:glycine/D-amino acid oxidase-like deaminating enzyme/nitrite reductase/ring-hydroxylating ferredoxin subunit
MSFWTMDCSIPERESLRGKIETDTVVIGAGLAGILTAKLLREKGIDAVVIEAGRIAGGNTAGTTAKITLQHGLIYADMIKTLGREKARQYAEANKAAIQRYAEFAQGVDCDYHVCPAYVYTLRDRDVLLRECEAALELGIDAAVTHETELPFEVKGALKYEGQARFHPLKFIREISRDLTVYENTQADGVTDGVVLTRKGSIRAKHVVIATHYPFINVPGFYFVRMHQDRTYMLALRGATKMDGMYIDADEGGYTFRGQGDILLFGGEGHRTGRNRMGGRYERLAGAARRYYPESAEIARWSAQDCVTQDKIPFIGRYSMFTPDMYVATGFRKWGITGSMVSAIIISSMIAGEEIPFAEVFNPARFDFGASGGGLAKDVRQITKGFALRVAPAEEDNPESIPMGSAAIVNINGRKRGLYRDDNGNAHIVTVKCPHLGCRLSWNPDERTWDCPCHGSRFGYDGKRIEGPAEVNDISRKSRLAEKLNGNIPVVKPADSKERTIRQ